MQDGIFITAPPGTTWPLNLQDVDPRLRERWPDVHTRVRHATVSNQDYLSFQVDLGGERRRGHFTDRSHLALQDGPPKFWADTIVWFLSLLPVDAQVLGMMEISAPATAQIPRDATAEQVTAILNELSSQ